MGTAMVLSPRFQQLLDQAARAGLLSLGEEDGKRVIHLVADAEFLHMRTREEITWENERKADTSDLSLVIPVRVRDGDACRYCGKVVSFGMRRGNRAGTYDHLIPGHRARSIDELVVACRGCNSGRGDGEGDRGPRYPLLPPPSEQQRYYSSTTLEWFKDQGTVFTDLGLVIPKRSRGAKDRKPGSQTRPDAKPLEGVGTTERAEHAATAPSGEQRSASQTRSADAASASSGDQRAGTARGSAADRDHQRERQDPARAPETSADAAPHTSGDQRAGDPSGVRAERLPRAEVAFQVAQDPAPTSANTASRTLLEAEGAASGNAGTGRDGSGRVGTDRVGTAREAAGQAAPGAGRRRKRGRRRRGRR
jgi:5-methylcytosine-specific restriction endonuclease McrA